MVEESITFGNNVNESHPRIGDTKVENLIFTKLSPETQIALQQSLEVFPEQYRPTIHPEHLPRYQTVLASSELNNPENQAGIIYIAGATGAAPAYAHVAAEMYRSAEKMFDERAGFSAVIGSSASIDTVEQRLPTNLSERAAYQAAFILELIKKKQCKNLYLLGQSLGGMEVTYIVPVLEKLLEIENIDTKISGLILFQAGGQYEQSLTDFTKSIPEFMSLKRGILEMWPSPLDELKAKEEMYLAKEKDDSAESFRWKMRLENIREKRQNREYLTDEEQNKLQEIDTKLQQLPSKKERKQLLKERYQLLYPAVQRISTTDARPRNISKELGAFLNTIRAAVLNKERKFDVVRSLPKWLREEITGIPVAFVWGREDEFFPVDSARNEMIKNRLEDINSPREGAAQPEPLHQRGKYFPNVPIVYDAEVIGSPHELANIDTQKFADIVANITSRMDEWNKKRQKNDTSGKQERIELHFQ
ncbi:hypothetical protein A3D01_05435 [Candidatus Woesebacteria bacterium RIFCSPHIGHO2_02_FULL_39_13]|uniref:Uncharacterized protein n=1 Tax=Candidatus Woesebacteria bacterium RIFCSPHIGHO2_02_FULL_39_13 TaxID=1802505 RepID=A0A1F7YXD4_9BACT|nr:MAG: hypothetical protein A3D01_05435 [Candidatus Woesebacteria bacterium RIFCSPHIGHO2_02_FULL_39_13]OGM72293.1 MAG: hypothetical protein A3H19_00115 [Candidatus Woesebacteria bacterium RIFCSPLOWO2_12_FULL_39_9]